MALQVLNGVLLLVIFGSCHGADISIEQPHKMEHLTQHDVLKLSALRSGDSSYYFSPEFTKEGFFRYDIKASQASNKNGFYGLLRQQYKIQYTMENCRKTIEEPIQGLHCLCFKAEGDVKPQASNICGAAMKDWAFVCLENMNGGQTVKYWNSKEKKVSSSKESCKNVILDVKPGSMDVYCGMGEKTGNLLFRDLAPPLITGEYVLGKSYKVQMINLVFKECGSAVLNGLYYTQNFHLTGKPKQFEVSLPKAGDVFDGSTCSKCQCKVDVDRFSGTLGSVGLCSTFLILAMIILYL